MEKVFLLMWGYRTDKVDCFKCGIDEFDESRNWTKRDIRDIDSLRVGDTWYDPDSDLRYLPKKKTSHIRVRRLK